MKTTVHALLRLQQGLLSALIFITITTGKLSIVYSQDYHSHPACEEPLFYQHKLLVEPMVEELVSSHVLKQAFESAYHFSFESFKEVNSYYIQYINRELLDLTFQSGQYDETTLVQLYMTEIEKYRQQDELLFHIPSDHNVTKFYYAKHGYNPLESNLDVPKTAVCLNAGFEENSWNGWTTQCATATNGFTYTNAVTYVPPAGCSSPAGTPQQHSIWSGGTDAIGGFSRVFNGGYSAMIGNGAQANNPQHQAAVLRKSFVVDPNNTIITYSYAAVLDNGGGHTSTQQPFFRVNLYVNGASEPCAQYSAYAGDGQAGWYSNGARWYRDWTMIAVPLQAYVGQTVTLEFSVSDCYVSGGSHYGYAYVDVSCNNLEVEQFCEGTSTVLTAPLEGIQSYQWSTGETTPSITITSPGTYTVTVLPYGSTCPSTLSFNATIFPTPTADFSVDFTSICAGGDVDFTNLSTLDPGATLASYTWNFGDGIVTPPGTGTISGVSNTSGTYLNANHIYSNVGNYNASVTITTIDGCTDTHIIPISVIEGPTATITGNNVVCENATSPLITFTGALTSGPFTFSYNLDGGPIQTITTEPGQTTVTLPVPTTTPGTYTYNLTYVIDPSTPQCEQPQTGTVTIVVNPLPEATIATPAVVCQGDAEPIVTFTGSEGTSDYQFTYTINSGSNNIISTAGTPSTTINQSTAVADTFIYVLTNVTDIATGCNQNLSGSQYQTIIVVNPMPDAQIAGSTVVCQNDSPPLVTFTGTNAINNYQFSYTLNGGSSQIITSPTGSNTATHAHPTDVAGTFTYILTNVQDPISGCNQSLNEQVEILVNPLPTATISGAITVCQYSDDPVVIFTGANGTSDYQFTYSINGSASQNISTNGSNEVTFTLPTNVDSTYQITLLSVLDLATGCTQAQSGEIIVRVNPMPDANLAGTTTVCQYDETPIVTFTGYFSTSNYTFGYTLNGGAMQYISSPIGSNIATIAQSTNTVGLYEYELVEVTDPSTLCTRTVNKSELITIRELPIASISSPIEVCHNDSNQPQVIFTAAQGDAPFTFSYTINGGPTQIVTSATSTHTITIPTNTVDTYSYTITHIQEGSFWQCAQAQNVNTFIQIHPLPIVSAGSDITICAGVPIILTGSGAHTYVWDNGVINGEAFTPTDTAVYTVIGTDINGCIGTDNMTVFVVPIPEMEFIGVNLSGCQPVTPTFTNLSTGNLTDCTWYLGNSQVVSGCGTIDAIFNDPGCFDVTLVVSTPEGCTNTLTKEDFVCVDANPIADFYPSPSELSTYDWESTMINESIGASSYYWNFGDGSAPETGLSPTHAFPNDEGGLYTVTLIASSPAGCLDTAYALVTLKDELIFYVPNTFTPDGDDYNQTFKPVFTTGYDPYNYGLYIFNRWGEMVFESHDTNVGWDGSYGNNAPVSQDGTYIWKIEVKRRQSDERKIFHGHVNILR